MKINSEIQDILAECYKDTKVLAKVLFPDLFFSEFSVLHDQIFDLIDSGAKKIAIAAPRGIGKTTIARTVAAKGILFRDTNFVSYVSNSASSAELQTENLKRDLLANIEVRKIFGNVKIADSEFQLDDTFAKTSWVAYGNTLVMPRGSGQQVRGLIWGKYRPQLIIIDDFENKDEIMNPEQRKKWKDWFHSDLEKSINRYNNDWRFIYIDTLKHEDALLQELIDSSDWESITLSVCNDKYESLAPSYITTEELKEEVETHKEKGILDIFYMEYMNLPIATEDASFKQGYFKYYNEPELDKSSVENIIIVDPAKTVKMQSAESAVLGLGINYTTNAIMVRDIVAEKLYPDELYDQMFDMKVRLNAHVMGIEVTGLEEFIKQPIENEMLKRGPSVSCELVWLKARSGPIEGQKVVAQERGKIRRIAALVPYYRQGYIYHNPNCCAQLEAQLLMFPRSKRKDIMDGLAYVIEMMDLGNRYFDVPDEDPDDSEAEFTELDYELPLTNWRTA